MTVIIEDGFSGTDGDDVTGRTPDTVDNSNTWIDIKTLSSSVVSLWGEIRDNKLQLLGNSGGQAVDSGISDGVITADWTPAVGVNNRNSLAFRYNSDGDMWQLNVREPNADINLQRIVSDSIVNVDTDSYTWTEGDTYALKVILSGASITCYVNDSEILSASDSAHQTETFHGLIRAGGDDATRFDNFVVDDGEAAAATVLDKSSMDINTKFWGG